MDSDRPPMHVILFDIDGTLVESNEFDFELYGQTVRAVLGIEVDDDWSAYRNVTDGGILDELIDSAGLQANRYRIHQEVKGAFARLVARYLKEHGGRLPEISGAKAFLDDLKSRPDVAVGLATGGWEETALMKLEAAGMDPGGLCLASGSDALTRVGIMQIAAERALNGAKASTTAYFGDGVWDKRASEELSYQFIAIGNNVNHPVRFADFQEPAPILKALGLPACVGP